MLSTLIHPQPVHAMGATSPASVHPQVEIWIDTATSSGQEIVKGILSYVRSHTAWRVSIPDRLRMQRPPETLASGVGRGVLAQVDSSEFGAVIASCQVPAVNICGEYQVPGLPLVATDDVAIAQMAVDHLAKLGFKRFGVCGRSQQHTSAVRSTAFLAKAQEIGVAACSFESLEDEDWEQARDRIARWLEKQPKPLGLMACNDALGQQILDACRAARLAVPRDVAVVGVGNDELICGLADPPMSSIVLDNRRIGYEAARRLHRMMQGHRQGVKELRIEPVGVAARPSTDALVVDDPDVAAAARFIREHALQGIKVADVLAAVPISRRVLETRFRNHFGRTLHQEILGVQLDYIKELLRETDQSMSQIASQSGFRHVEYMSVVFKREVGITPSEFRRNWRKRR